MKTLMHYLPTIIGVIGIIAWRMTVDSDKLLPLSTLFLLIAIGGLGFNIVKQAWNHYKPEINNLFEKENNNNGKDD